MAEHADATDQITNPESTDLVETTDTGTGQRERFSSTRLLIAAGLAVVVALAGVAGWHGYRGHQASEVQAQRNSFVQAARQAAINLTTISYTDVDADITRILDSSTGTFRDDFQKRSGPFVEIVKQVQSKSEGEIAEAGLESETGDQAQVLVAVSMKISTAAAPEPDTRRWRWRISVQKTSDGAKVSNVVFVP